MILPFFEKRFLSIDFGSINIKIVEGVRNKNKVEIVNFGIIPIINFKELATSSYILEENIASILKSFLEETKMRAKKAIFNITAPYSFSANFVIPNIPEKSLPQVIKFESQKQVPLSIEEIEFEYRSLQVERSDNLKQWLVFLTAVPKNYLKKLENISSLANLKFSGYGFEYLNLEPYFQEKIGDFVAIDLGHAYSTFYLIRSNKIIYATRLKLRGYDFLNSVMNVTGFSEEQVLDLVSKRGILFSPEEKELKTTAESFLNYLVTGIQKEIERIENDFILRVEKIYWTGGLFLLNGFKDEMLKRFSRYQHEIISPSDYVIGERFKLLGEKSTIFSQTVGILIKKILG